MPPPVPGAFTQKRQQTMMPEAFKLKDKIRDIYAAATKKALNDIIKELPAREVEVSQEEVKLTELWESPQNDKKREVDIKNLMDKAKDKIIAESKGAVGNAFGSQIVLHEANEAFNHLSDTILTYKDKLEQKKSDLNAQHAAAQSSNDKNIIKQHMFVVGQHIEKIGTALDMSNKILEKLSSSEGIEDYSAQDMEQDYGSIVEAILLSIEFSPLYLNITEGNEYICSLLVALGYATTDGINVQAISSNIKVGSSLEVSVQTNGRNNIKAKNQYGKFVCAFASIDSSKNAAIKDSNQEIIDIAAYQSGSSKKLAPLCNVNLIDKKSLNTKHFVELLKGKLRSPLHIALKLHSNLEIDNRNQQHRTTLEQTARNWVDESFTNALNGALKAEKEKQLGIIGQKEKSLGEIANLQLRSKV